MTIPLGLGPAASRRPLPLDRRSQSAGPAPTVLLVDDEPEVVEELAGLLGRRFLRVLSAGSAEAGLALLQENPEVAVLVTDIRLPGLDGLALARAALRGRAEAEALEVVLITGHASATQTVAVGRLGAFGMLEKPMRGADLARMVQDALARVALRRGGATGFGWAARPTAIPALPPIPAPPPRFAPPPPAQDPGLAEAARAAEALLQRLAQRVDAAGHGLQAILRDLHGPLGDLLRASPRVPPGSPGLLPLLDELLDVAALEAGAARPSLAPVPAAALAEVVSARLAAAGLRCSRRITLQPDADPAPRLDAARLARALALLAPAGAGSADLSVEAGAGLARLEIVVKPDLPAPAASRLGLAIARRLACLLGGVLDVWPQPGGMRARLVVRGA
jgi:CheY-like chemotaxis protein